MNDLKDLLISRIQDIKILIGNHQINNKQKSNINQLQQHPNISHSVIQKCFFQINSTQNHIITEKTTKNHPLQPQKIKTRIHFLIKKRQKTRANNQTKLLIALNNSTFLKHKQVQEFYLFSLQIFESFDPQFSKYKNQSSFMSVSMQQNLKKLYSFFFLKHDQQVSGKLFIPEISKLDVMDLSPSFFIGWIKKWSTNILQSLLNLNEDNNEFKIGVKLNIRKIKEKILNQDLTFDIFTKKNRSNSFNFIPKSKSFIESPHKMMKQPKQNKTQNTFQGKISKLLSTLQQNEPQIFVPVNSKQLVYSYCLEELKIYYKNYPLEDLDYGYLRSFKKIGKKDQILIGSNSKNAIQALIETKNNSIKVSMAKYQNQFNKFKFIQKTISSKKQINSIKNQSLSQNFSLSNQKQSQISTNQSGPLNFDQNRLSSLGSKLLSPINKAYRQQRKMSKMGINQKDDPFFSQNQKMRNEKISYENTCSNSMQLRTEIINYNQIFSQKKNDQINKNQNKIELLKRFNQRFAIDEMENDKVRQFDKQKMNSFESINESNNNFPKLPKLSLKAKSKHLNKKRILNLQTEDRFNKSELISQNKKSYFQDKLNTEEINQIFYPQGLRLQKIIETPSKQIIGKRFISEVSQKQQIQRSMSHFSSNTKLFIGSKKPSLNLVKFPKNKSILNDQSTNFQALTAFKNKLKEKNSLKQKNKNQKAGGSQNLKAQIFSPEKIGSDSQAKKDQFIEYLKNLHGQKIKSQVFQSKEMKQKQNLIKRKSP